MSRQSQNSQYTDISRSVICLSTSICCCAREARDNYSLWRNYSLFNKTSSITLTSLGGWYSLGGPEWKHCGVNTWRQLPWRRLVLWASGSLEGDLFPGTRHETHIFLKRGGLLGCVVFGLAACGLVGGATLRHLLFRDAVFVHLSLLGSQQRQRLANFF